MSDKLIKADEKEFEWHEDDDHLAWHPNSLMKLLGKILATVPEAERDAWMINVMENLEKISRQIADFRNQQGVIDRFMEGARAGKLDQRVCIKDETDGTLTITIKPHDRGLEFMTTNEIAALTNRTPKQVSALTGEDARKAAEALKLGPFPIKYFPGFKETGALRKDVMKWLNDCVLAWELHKPKEGKK